jgi:hypothetical protein
MIEQPLPPNEPPAPQAAASLEAQVPGPVRYARPRWWGLLGAGLLACVGLSCGLLAFAAHRIAGEQDDIAAVIDAVMGAMAAGEADRAYVLFSPQVQSPDLKAGLESSLTGVAFVLYDGYHGLELSNVTIGVQAGTDPAEPHGVVAQAAGLIYYRDGFVGTFEAVLIKEQGAWKLWGININTSPERLGAYQASDP